MKTDHQSLKYLLRQRVRTLAQQRWITKLLRYAFIVKYKERRENVVVDALSKRHDEEIGTTCFASESPTPAVLASAISTASEGTLCIISFPTPTWLSGLKLSYASDSKI